MVEDPSGADREVGSEEQEPHVDDEAMPDSIDVQPEDPDWPGRASPEPIE